MDFGHSVDQKAAGCRAKDWGPNFGIIWANHQAGVVSFAREAKCILVPRRTKAFLLGSR